MLTISPQAVLQIQSLRHETNRPNAALRVAVQGGDCTGLKYFIGLDDFRAADDLCIRIDDVEIFVDRQSASYLAGSEIDWIEVDGESGFVIFNPNKGRSQGGCSNTGDGQGCMTLGDGKHCVKDKTNGCDCGADSIDIVYKIT